MGNFSGEVFMMEAAAAELDLQAAAKVRRQTLREADPAYWELIDQTARQAEVLKATMIETNHDHWRGNRLGKFLFGRKEYPLALNFSGGTVVETPMYSEYYLSIETPPLGVEKDIETGMETGWVFELRTMPPGAQGFFNERDADRPTHYWVRYGQSPLYISRTSGDLGQMTKPKREKLYSIHLDGDPSISSTYVGDTEMEARVAAYHKAEEEAAKIIDGDFPDMVKLFEDKAKEFPEGLTDEAKGDRAMLALAGNVIEWTNFLGSERGREHQKRIDEAVRAAGFTDPFQPSLAAIENCQMIIQTALAELNLHGKRT